MEEFEEPLEFTSKSSKINSAMILNIYINDLFKDYSKHFREGKYLNCNNDLDMIWVILGGEPSIEDSQTEKDYKKLNEVLFKLGLLSNGVESRGFNKIDKETIIKLNKQRDILLDKGLFLSRLRNEQGKGTAYADPDDMLI
jgi:hypothetical protein